MRTDGFARERHAMVERQLAAEGIHDPRVLAAMEGVPRHLFLPPERWDEAYAPRAVPIGAGQTISQPWIVARMTQALELRGDECVMEIGTGSGYQAAVLDRLADFVLGIERIEGLAHRARRTLDEVGATRVAVVVGDGSDPGFVQALFDRILVTAAAPALPRSLLEHLADPGILVCPVGDAHLQVLQVLRREGGRDRLEVHEACRFVPLLGREGFRRAPGD